MIVRSTPHPYHRGCPSAWAVLSVGCTAMLLLFAAPSHAVSTGVDRDVLLQAANTARTARGLSALREDPLLTDAAQARAEELLRSGTFAHERPDGSSFATAVATSGYPFARVAENLAMDYLHEAPMVRGWLTSPSHRNNLLNAAYVDAGVGIAYGTVDGTPTTIVVQLLGAPLEPPAPSTVRIPITSGIPLA